MPDKAKFLKGLAVIDDIAYFGVSVWSERSARGNESQDSELAAFCLRGMELLWRREASSAAQLTCFQLIVRCGRC